MLVLTRRVGESILIGEDVEITLVRVDGEQVRIGVSAPRDILVQRKELAEQVRLENLKAAAAAQQTDATALEALERVAQPHSTSKNGLSRPAHKIEPD
jgi:carbon storage regulator